MDRLDEFMQDCWQKIQQDRAQKKASGEYKEPEYQCSVCKDQRYIYYEKNGEQFGKPCQCEIKRRNMKRLEKSGLAEIAKNYTLDSFKTEEVFQKAVKEKAEHYLKFGTGKWLVVVGQTGAGKTHICTGTCVKLIETGREVRYFRWRDEGARIKRYANKPEEYDRLLTPFKTCEVLYVDDLFKIRDTKSISEGDFNLAFELLDYRYNNRLMTIISSERDMHEFREIDGAIAGRIEEMSKGYYIDINPEDNRNYRRKVQ